MNLDQILKLAAEVQALREKLTTAEEALGKATGIRAQTAAVGGHAAKNRKPGRPKTPPLPGTKTARVLDALRDGPRRATEIAQVAELSTNYTATCLHNLVKRGLVVWVDRGVYRAA